MIDDHRAMPALTPSQQAERALRHFLQRVKDSPEVGYYCGSCTETFALATEALASLINQSPLTVRTTFEPRNARDPRAVMAPAVPAPFFSDEDKESLHLLIAHHEAMAGSLREAASLARMQQGFGLYAQADQHEARARFLFRIGQEGGAL